MSQDVALQAAAARLSILLDCEHECLTLAELLERAHAAIDTPAASADDEVDASALREDLDSTRWQIEDIEGERDGWRDAAWALAKLCGAPDRVRTYDDLEAWAKKVAAPRQGIVGLAARAPWMSEDQIITDLAQLFEDLEWHILADALRKATTQAAA